MQKKVVLIGGPGTGKSSVLNELIARDFHCMPEVSREVTLEAQKQGIEQLFLTDPLYFSEKLFEGRERQFLEATNSKNSLVFFDRGLPDVYAYLEYSGTPYPDYFKEKCREYIYDKIFLFLPWKDIYESDNERYETYSQLVAIDTILQKAYKELGYELNIVPFGSINERTDYIINQVNH